MAMTLLRPLASVLMGISVALVGRIAVADDDHRGAVLDLAADLDGAAIVSPPHTPSGNTLSHGSGFKVRVGAQFRYPLLRFVPEILYGYEHFLAVDGSGTAYDWNTHRLVAGARIGVGEVIVPSLYAHAGDGWRATGDPTVPQVGGTAFDVGIALDLHVIPHLGFGAHVEYDTIDSTPYAPDWVTAGLQADVAF